MKINLKSISLVAASLLMVVTTATQAKASIFASAYKEITGARIQVSADNITWADAVNGTDFVVLGFINGASTDVNLNGASLIGFGGGIDAPSAYLDDSPLSTLAGALGGPAENSAFGAGAGGTTPVGAAVSYIHSDIASLPGSGDLITAPGAGVLMTASTELDTLGDYSSGVTNGVLTAIAVTNIQALEDAFYRVQFDYLINLTTDIGPPGGTATAESTWIMAVTGTGLDGNENAKYEPGELNKSRSNGADYLASSLVTGKLASAGINLLKGSNYTYTINSTVGVDATTVPEPGSIIIWSFLAMLGFVAMRRRSSSK